MSNEIAFAEDNTYTLNSLKKVLQCNRLTAEKYITKGNYKKTRKTYNGNDFDAWIIPEQEIKRLKSNLSYTQSSNSVTSETSVNKSNKTSDDITGVNASVTSEMLRNIKELNGRITTLENDNRDLMKEVKELTSENTTLSRDKATIESKILLIEDKNRTIESENAKQRQEAEKLEKKLKASRIINLIYTVLTLMLMTAAVTLQIAKSILN